MSRWSAQHSWRDAILRNAALAGELDATAPLDSYHGPAIRGLPFVGRELAAGVVTGRLYAVGGANNNGFLNSVEAYDPTTNVWTAEEHMPTARQSLPSITALQLQTYVTLSE